MLRLWRGARQKLFLRHSVLREQPAVCKKLELLKQALLESEAAGFATVLSEDAQANEASGSHAQKPKSVAQSDECKQGGKVRADVNPVLEDGSMESELVLRLKNRWESEKAR